MASLEAAILIISRRTRNQLQTTRADSPQHEEELGPSEQLRIHLQGARLRRNLGTCLRRHRALHLRPSLPHLLRLYLIPRSSAQRYGLRPSRSQVGRCQQRVWTERTRRQSSVQSLFVSSLCRDRRIRVRKLDQSIRRLQKNRRVKLTRWTLIRTPLRPQTPTLPLRDLSQRHPHPRRTRHEGQALCLQRPPLLLRPLAILRHQA